jgi:hypothetical protein
MALVEDMVLHKLKCTHEMFMLLFVLGSKCRTNKMMLIGTCSGFLSSRMSLAEDMLLQKLKCAHDLTNKMMLISTCSGFLCFITGWLTLKFHPF